MVSIGRMTLLVYDLDVARTFYVSGFGFDVLFDGEVAPGLRTIHVGPDGPRGAGLWLLQTDQPELSAAARARTAGEPALVLYTDDLDADLARLRAIHVEPIQGPDEDGMGSRFAHLLDPSANEIVLVQVPGPAGSASQETGYREGVIGLVEFPTDDPARSAAFYHDLFGWEVSEGPYRMFKAGDLTGAFPDTVNGFPALRGLIEPGDTIVYVVVANVNASLAKAASLGAKILLLTTRTAPDHEMALIADPSGAKIALARSGNLDT
ncbi:MAG TPA: VOC family protein [Thermomicrobiales bacterium]|nr:VOC family protein [Thermomicrobiales bacterium]